MNKSMKEMYILQILYHIALRQEQCWYLINILNNFASIQITFFFYIRVWNDIA